MGRSDRTPKQRTPTEKAEVVAGYFGTHVADMASRTSSGSATTPTPYDASDAQIINALRQTQKMLMERYSWAENNALSNKTKNSQDTLTAAAQMLKDALPRKMGPHPTGYVSPHTALETKIDAMAGLLKGKDARESVELAANLDVAIRNADVLLAQHAKLQTELTTLQAKATPTPGDTARITALTDHIKDAASAITQVTTAKTSAKSALAELPTSEHSTPTLIRATTPYAAQSEGKTQLEKLKTAYKNATTKQYRTTNELFAKLGGGAPPQIDKSVIALLKAQATDDQTKELYKNIETKIDTINAKLEELHKLQAELALPNDKASKQDIEKHQNLLNEITAENAKLANMFFNAQDLLGAHAELAKQSAALEQLTVQLRAVPGGEKMPILGNATLELTKNELDQKFTCGVRTWNKMEKKWDTRELDVNPTRQDLEAFVTNWNASLKEWNKAHPFDQRKPIALKGNPTPHTLKCGNEENRSKVLKEFVPKMQQAEKDRDAAAKATVKSSSVPAGTTTSTAAPTTTAAHATTTSGSAGGPGHPGT